jgi:hypothetical protein
MSKPKRSIMRDSVFRSTGNEVVTPKQGILKQEPQMHQTAIWLGDEEEQWIDAQCQQIKKGGWRGITRSAYIRALIRASMQQEAIVEGVTGEAELAQRLTPH